jgi:hypothetical protein
MKPLFLPPTPTSPPPIPDRYSPLSRRYKRLNRKEDAMTDSQLLAEIRRLRDHIENARDFSGCIRNHIPDKHDPHIDHFLAMTESHLDEALRKGEGHVMDSVRQTLTRSSKEWLGKVVAQIASDMIHTSEDLMREEEAENSPTVLLSKILNIVRNSHNRHLGALEVYAEVLGQLVILLTNKEES